MSNLSPLHRRALAAGMADIERRIADLEAALGAHATPLAEYSNDLTVDEQEQIREYFALLRAAMVECARDHDIPLDRRTTSLRWIMQSGASMLRVAVDDLGERRLKGYGEISPAARQELLDCQQTLGTLVDDLARLVAPDSGSTGSER